MTEHTIADKVACLKRELAFRRNVYAKCMREGTMTQDQADREIAVMVAIVADYEGRP